VRVCVQSPAPNEQHIKIMHKHFKIRVTVFWGLFIIITKSKLDRKDTNIIQHKLFRIQYILLVYLFGVEKVCHVQHTHCLADWCSAQT